MSSLGWGLYLAISWTWCIGLFLPVILAADAGPGAWPIFLACNLVGAASVPFMLRTRRQATGFLRRNLGAARVFSVVTILCQAWFMGWAARRLPASVAAAGLGGVALLLPLGRRRAGWVAAALGCWLATAAAGIAYVAASPNAHLAATLAQELSWHPGALFALPLVLAGFLASPYLDLTFHHAARAAPHPRRAFALVFPPLFAAMLLVALAYRDELAPVMLHAAPTPGWLVPILLVLVLQVGFTLVLHLRHLPRRAQPGTALAAGAAALLAWALGDTPMPGGHSLNELAYRASIGFYGVLVPCWVWAAAIPGRRPGPLAVALALAALALAAIPMLLAPTLLPLYPAAFLLILLTRLAPAPIVQEHP